MELRHLRYFLAIAEEGSLTVAAEKRLHVAQPSLSRQMRDLEIELGVTLMTRGARGVVLTPAGEAFREHARLTLLQVEAGVHAARRAAEPAKTVFTLGFQTGYEMEWLPAVMSLLREALPTIQVVIASQNSPELAAGLVRGQIDLAFARPDPSPGLNFIGLRKEPLVVVMPVDHRLAGQDTVAPGDIPGEVLVGVPNTTAPALRAVTDAYGRQVGVDLKPHHTAENLSMAFSLVASTRGVCLLPLYARDLLPLTLTSRPLSGPPPLIDFGIAYSQTNTSPLLKFVLSKLDDLKFRVAANHHV